MCGRFTLATPAAEWAALFDVEPLEVQPRYNVAPTDEIVVVRQDGDERTASLLRWGLIPSWAESAEDFPLLINARSESIHRKPSFRDSFAARRCLVIADGFYEWASDGGRKRPHWIHLPDRRPFGMAAVWDDWRGERTGVRSCAVVTTAASEDLAGLHDRMPVILDVGGIGAWLDPASDPATLFPLFDPGAPGRFSVREVSPRVNSVRFDDAECLRPFTSQPDLFLY